MEKFHFPPTLQELIIKKYSHVVAITYNDFWFIWQLVVQLNASNKLSHQVESWWCISGFLNILFQNLILLKCLQ